MERLIQKKTLFNIIVMTFIAMVLQYLKSIKLNSSLVSQQKFIAVIAIIVFMIIILSVFIETKKIDIYIIFIVCSFFFLFGQQLLLLLGTFPTNMTLLSNRLDRLVLYHSGFFILQSFLVMHLGYLISCLFVKSNKITLNNEDEQNDRKSLFMVSRVIFFIVLFPTLIVLLRNIRLSIIFGYGERVLNNNIQSGSIIISLFSLLSNFMIPTLLALFISKGNRKWPILAIITYLTLYMLSGSRLSAFMLITGVLFIQNALHKKMNKNLFMYLVFFVGVVFVFSVVSKVRGDFGNIQNTVSVNEENNFLVSAISEAGYTFSATSVVMQYTPARVPYQLGNSYLSAILYILPNFMTYNYFNNYTLSTDATFMNYLNDYGSGIGSSFIAEGYFNFGIYSLLVFFLYGIVLGFLSKNVEYSIKTKDYTRLFILIYSFVLILFFIRSDTRTFFRNFVWFGIPIWVLAKLVKKKNLLKNQKDN